MKIDNTLRTGGTGPVFEPRSDKAAPGAESGETASSEVRVSGLATELHAIESQAAGSMADAGRVSEIKQAITEGRLQINPEVIADKLIETVRELLSAYRNRP